jgi:hypothetical protein
MRADEAFAQSAERLIAAVTQYGLVTLYHQPRSENSGEAFHLRFIPCDAHGHFNAAGTVAVGSYEKLDVSLRIAVANYGLGEGEWMPTSIEQLERASPFTHAPRVEGRSINPVDETEIE